MRPLKIALLHHQANSSFRVRCQAPAAWLQKQGAIEVVPPLHAWSADVVILHQQWLPGAEALVASLKRHGIRVVVDIDEDIFNPPTEHPSSASYRDREFQRRARQVLNAADAVFASTEYLGQHVGAAIPS